VISPHPACAHPAERQCRVGRMLKYVINAAAADFPRLPPEDDSMNGCLFALDLGVQGLPEPLFRRRPS
jgi:hypothetical protein